MKQFMFLFVILVILQATFVESAEIRVTPKPPLAMNATASWGSGFSSKSYAVNTATGDTLVVWVTPKYNGFSRDIGTVFGRIFDLNGKPITPNIRIVEPAGEAAVAYNPFTREYLLAFEEPGYHIPAQIHTLRLDTKARPLGKAVPITTDPPAIGSQLNFAPTVLFNPRTNGYAIFWATHFKEEAAEGVSGLYGGRLLNQRGEPDGSYLTISEFRWATGVTDSWISHWIYLPSAKTFLGIGCKDAADLGGGYVYRIAKVDSNLKKIRKSTIYQQPIIHESPAGTYDSSFHLALVSDNSAVAYFRDENGIIKGIRIDAKGNVRGTAFNALSDRLKDTTLFGVYAEFIRTSSGPKGILIGTERHPGGANAWAQPLNAIGTPVGTPVKVLGVSETQFIFTRLVGLAAKPDAKAFRFLGFENAPFLDSPLKNWPIYRLQLDLIP